jgi:type I restriction enzyme S subunit
MGLANSSAVVHPVGSVILLRDAGIGKSSVLGADMAVSQHFMAWNCGPRLDNWFLYYYLQSMKPELERISNGSTIKTIGLEYFRQLEIPLPTIGEQRQIAQTLRDADDLISALERGITKKQAIKQGLMQQLLTGKTRLPGFTDDWREVKLRDEGTTYGGLAGKDKNDFGAGSASFVTFMEVMASARLLGHRLERVRVRPGERQNQVQRGDVLFNGSSETPEEVALATVVEFNPSPATYLNSFCFGYRLKDTRLIDPTFLAYFFRSGNGRELVASLAQGATRYNIAKTKLLEVQPSLPPVDEQQAIVEVLRDAESELAALSFRLAKVRAVKTGMMQQLLTGRTRLPVREGAA